MYEMLLFILPKSPLFDISSGKNNVSCCLLLRGGSGVPICLFPSDKLLELRLLCWRWGWMGGGEERGRWDGELVFGGNGVSVWDSERFERRIMVRVEQQYRCAWCP